MIDIYIYRCNGHLPFLISVSFGRVSCTGPHVQKNVGKTSSRFTHNNVYHKLLDSYELLDALFNSFAPENAWFAHPTPHHGLHQILLPSPPALLPSDPDFLFDVLSITWSHQAITL